MARVRSLESKGWRFFLTSSPEWSWGPLNRLQNEYRRLSPDIKAAERRASHHPYSYCRDCVYVGTLSSTYPMGLHGLKWGYLYLYLCLGNRKVLLTSDLPTRTLYQFLDSSIRAICPAHLSRLALRYMKNKEHTAQYCVSFSVIL